MREGRRDGPASGRSGRAFGALRYRDFRLFWGGAVISHVGGWMQQVAQGWLIYDLTGSAFLVGLNGLFQSIPFVLMSFYAGTVIDRVDRRKLLIWVEAASMAIVVLVGLLIVTGLVQVWHIYASGIAQALVGAFESPARSSLLPHLVPRADLMTAISLQSIQRKGAQIIGPALGGIFVARFGVAGAYFVHAGAFVVLVACLLLMRSTNPASARSAQQPLQAIAEGLRYVRAESVIGTLIVVEIFLSIFTSFQPMMVVFARKVFDVGPEGLGFLQSAVGFGSVVGSVGLAAAGDIRHKGRLLMVTGLVYCAALVGFAFSPGFLLAMGILAFIGAMDIIFGATRQTIIQLLTPDVMLGRVMSLSAISMRGLGPFGGFQAGTLTSLLGSVQLATAVGAAICLVVLGVAGLRSPMVRAFTGAGAAGAGADSLAPTGPLPRSVGGRQRR